MEKPKRKHRATGKPRGGPRPGFGGRQPGAGRPLGSKSALGYGETKAIKAIRWRVPEGAPAEVAETADQAFQKLVDVMNGKVHYLQAGHTLKAATRIREEVCGPIAQKHQHEGSLQIRVIDPYAEPEGEDAG